jgi:UDP-N-acetylmuramoyl-tripeptide--D-alanyl-D-alanine ligase
LISLASVQAACGGRWLGAPPASPRADLAGASTDTRSLAPNEVFFALTGPRFDGHAFVRVAREKGAAAAVVQRPIDDCPGWPVLLVEDTTRALGALAHHVRSTVSIPVVGITGSVGKTTTKEFTAHLLRVRGPVLSTRGNLNNHIGVPLTLLRLQPDSTAAVVEMGMSAPGEILVLTRITRPDVAVITNVAPVHLEFFESIESIAHAKAEILEGLGPNGLAVLNHDDARVRAIGAEWGGRVLWFGIEEPAGCDIVASEIREDWRFSDFVLRLGSEHHAVHLPLPGRHVVANFLAAAGVAQALGIPGAQIARQATSLQPAAGRGQRRDLGQGVTLVDDSYNANPLAVEAAVRVLAVAEGRRRRVAVLGDMLELGPTSPDIHRDTGRRVAGHVDVLVGVGPLAAHLLEGAREAGLASAAVHGFDDAETAAREVPELVEPGDVVLVKGSRGVHTERVVEALASRLGEVS